MARQYFSASQNGCLTTAKTAADEAEPDLADATKLDAYDLDVLQHAALVAVHGKAVTAFNVGAE